MPKSRQATSSTLKHDGNKLVADFQAAITNLATMQTAQHEAENSELNTLVTLDSINQQNGLYVTPEDIPDDIKEQLTKTSLDAHLKKVQSEQITNAALQQVTKTESDAKSIFIGKKVVFYLEDATYQPFEAVWVNTKTGQFTTSILRSMRITGILDDISFSRNLVVLRPTLVSRLITPSRRFFLVHIINTTTLTPAVSAIC